MTVKQKSLEPMVFEDVKPIEVPVTVGNEKYILREATEAAMIQVKALAAGAIQVDPKTKQVTTIPGQAGKSMESNSLLVSLCLLKTLNGEIRKDTSGNPVPVGKALVQSWPPRIVQALFERVKDISAGVFDEPSQEQRENEFREAAEKLYGFSESPKDREDWCKWMHGVVDVQKETANDGASLEDPAKNGRSAGTATSASPATSVSD